MGTNNNFYYVHHSKNFSTGLSKFQGRHNLKGGFDHHSGRLRHVLGAAVRHRHAVQPSGLHRDLPAPADYQSAAD
jgi:hypothetical protein